ncbi:MAG: hypothetical protein K2I63_02075, partial [Helicobacter sp.]|nr:hypothetical protein [Helicobacter sp.]
MEEIEEFFKDIHPLQGVYVIDKEGEESSDRVAIILSLDQKGFYTFLQVPLLEEIAQKYLGAPLSYALIMQAQRSIFLELQKESVSAEFVQNSLQKLERLRVLM